MAGTLEDAWAETLAAMADDLNTPIALAAAYRGAGEVLSASREDGLSAASAESARLFLNRVDDLLGIVGHRAETAAPEPDPLADQVEALLAQRTEARDAKDWARADAIRDEIDALGVVVMDTPSGPNWRRA